MPGINPIQMNFLQDMMMK